MQRCGAHKFFTLSDALTDAMRVFGLPKSLWSSRVTGVSRQALIALGEHLKRLPIAMREDQHFFYFASWEFAEWVAATNKCAWKLFLPDDAQAPSDHDGR
jgi:hypothetical protein